MFGRPRTRPEDLVSLRWWSV